MLVADITRMSEDAFRESAIRGLRALNARGEFITDAELAEDENRYVNYRAGLERDDGVTVTSIVTRGTDTGRE